MIESLGENFLASKSLFHLRVKHTDTRQTKTGRNNVPLYIRSLKESMENYRGKAFCFHKLLALKFQLGFERTILVPDTALLSCLCPHLQL